VIAAGATGIAVTGFLSRADDPGRAAAALRSALDA
jgi:thiamine monophosphate synthase